MARSKVAETRQVLAAKPADTALCSWGVSTRALFSLGTRLSGENHAYRSRLRAVLDWDYDSAMARDLDETVTTLESLIADAGGVDRLITPRGWPHLGLVIIDAVFSLQAKYDTVVKPILKNYCDNAPGITWESASTPLQPEHDAQSLLNFFGSKALEERCDILTWNVGPGTAKNGREGYRKADIVVDIANNLVRSGVVTRADFLRVSTTDPSLEWVVREVPGVGFACWKYMLNLSGVEVSKPDTMVLRWLGDVLGVEPSQKAGAALIENATAVLQARGIPVTVRQVDHLVWRKVTGRPLGTEPH
jgi:hypothetical protein